MMTSKKRWKYQPCGLYKMFKNLLQCVRFLERYCKKTEQSLWMRMRSCAEKHSSTGTNSLPFYNNTNRLCSATLTVWLYQDTSARDECMTVLKKPSTSHTWPCLLKNLCSNASTVHSSDHLRNLNNGRNNFSLGDVWEMCRKVHSAHWQRQDRDMVIFVMKDRCSKLISAMLLPKCR